MIIEMSLDHYDRFLEKCDASCREYEILKNGLIVRRPKDGVYERIMEIACEIEEAKILFSCSTRLYPDAAGAIAKAIARARDS
jgi:hypothetical protein